MKIQENIFSLDFNVTDVPNVLAQDEAQINIEKGLKEAHENGYSEGLKRGFEEGVVQGELGALRKSEQHQQNAFIEIYKCVDAIIQQESIYDRKMESVVVNLVTTLMKKVLPYYFNKYGVDEIEHAIRYIISTLLDHQDIGIFVSPRTIEYISERIADIQGCFPNKITLHADDALKEWECRIDWKGGGARWSQPHLLDNIQEIFTHFMQSIDSDKESGK
jgi:flagellar biosynthesis/type III secretory pathway protein FliH